MKAAIVEHLNISMILPISTLELMKSRFWLILPKIYNQTCVKNVSILMFLYNHGLVLVCMKKLDTDITVAIPFWHTLMNQRYSYNHSRNM